VEKIIARGGADTQKLVELHFLAGKLAAGLDRVDVAQEHFARVLSLEPGTTLPDGTSPKITMPFDAARGQTAPLRISLQDQSAVVVEADPLQMVARTGVTADEAYAFDRYGNVVWHQHVEREPRHPLPPPLPPPSDRPIYKHELFWVGGVLAFGAFAGFSAWRFSLAQDQWDDYKAAGTHDYSELVDIEHRGHRWAAATYGGIGAAAICGALALVTSWRHQTMLYAAPNSVGIGVEGRF
ncbi:MAG TPA: hypothetical protein VL326_24145, partial [Kofleriaceae bacterium]|nr:hypothetical protein [Kofleriaceae bacterium]